MRGASWKPTHQLTGMEQSNEPVSSTGGSEHIRDVTQKTTHQPVGVGQSSKPESSTAASEHTSAPVRRKLNHQPKAASAKKSKLEINDNLAVQINSAIVSAHNHHKITRPEAQLVTHSSSRRKLAKCGHCRRGFGGMEMWVLVQRYLGRPARIPYCPTTIPKHLVCMNCCPRDKMNDSGIPTQEIVFPRDVYPDENKRPILTREECGATGEVEEHDIDHYLYASASYVDYTKQIINQGRALHGDAGGDYDAGLAEMAMIKSEL